MPFPGLFGVGHIKAHHYLLVKHGLIQVWHEDLLVVIYDLSVSMILKLTTHSV